MFDNREISGEQDILVWEGLERCFTKEQKKNVIVKVHPREVSVNRYDRFGWKFVENCTYSQEEIIANLRIRPKCVIGITTSTLLNISALFGIKSISLVKLFMKQDIPQGSRRDCADFLKLCGDMVLTPADESELKRILEEL